MKFKSISIVSLVLLITLSSCGNAKPANKESKEEATSETTTTTQSTNSIPGAKIGWANSDSVSKYYDLSIKLTANLTTQQQDAEATLQGLYAKYQKKQAALQKEAPILGQTELQQKMQKLQELEQTIMMKEQELQQDLANKEFAATTSFIELTNEYMQEIGKELGYDYIISFKAGGQLMYGNPEYDITDIIIKKLNTAYHNSEIDNPE